MRTTRREAAKLDGEALYQKAVRLLAARGRSEVELRRALRPKAASPADMEAALLRLRDHGYLDDRRLAAGFTLYQREIVRHGKMRALCDLRARGVSAGIAEEAVQNGYAGTNEDTLLRSFLRARRVKPPADIRQAASLCRKLLRAGFSPAACQRALKAWKLDPEWIQQLGEMQEESE